MYGHETDSVFTDEDCAQGDHISFRSGNYSCSTSRYEEPFPLRKRVLSDPAIHQNTADSTSDLYVNLHENLSLHSRYGTFEYISDCKIEFARKVHLARKFKFSKFDF